MEAIVITSIICLTIIWLNIINRQVNMRKVEALEKMQETLLNNAEKLDDADYLYSILSSIENALN